MLSKRDQERLDFFVAWEWDMGSGWTQYRDSEPMVGHLGRLGSMEHAVLQAQPTNGANVCTRRALCGRSGMFSRATKRAFDDVQMGRAGKACPICERLIGPFREWQASRPAVS